MPLVTSARRSLQVAGAFFRIGLQQDLSYPLGFMTSQLSSVISVIIFFFVARQFDQPGYFTFVLIGLVSTRVLDAGVRGFSTEMDIAINRGWLEMFLVEPVRWRLLPISMVQWRAVQGVVNALLMVGIGIVLGVRFAWDGVPAAVAILLLGLVAGLAGVHAVISSCVSQRRREIGVRLAVGGTPAEVTAMIMQQGGRFIVSGVLVGMAVAFGTARLLGALLFGVTAHDITIHALVGASLCGVALLACWWPARRATRVNPFQALRGQ